MKISCGMEIQEVIKEDKNNLLNYQPEEINIKKNFHFTKNLQRKKNKV